MITVKKAIKTIDWWIDHKKTTMETFREKWKDSDDTYGVETAIMDSDKTIIENLELIRKELVSNCKHPKKMRDRTADGLWYCMNCNLDLD